jgi:hypothetical protein
MQKNVVMIAASAAEKENNAGQKGIEQPTERPDFIERAQRDPHRHPLGEKRG